MLLECVGHKQAGRDNERPSKFGLVWGQGLNRSDKIEIIDQRIEKLRRRIEEVKRIDPTSVKFNDAEIDSLANAIQDTVREALGSDSVEARDPTFHRIWHGGHIGDDTTEMRQEKFARGIPQMVSRLEAVIRRLEEEKEFATDDVPNNSDERTSDREPDGRTAIERFKRHRFILLLGLCAVVVASTYGVIRVIYIQPQALVIERLERDLADARAKLGDEPIQAAAVTVEADLIVAIPMNYDAYLKWRFDAAWDHIAAPGNVLSLRLGETGISHEKIFVPENLLSTWSDQVWSISILNADGTLHGLFPPKAVTDITFTAKLAKALSVGDSARISGMPFFLLLESMIPTSTKRADALRAMGILGVDTLLVLGEDSRFRGWIVKTTVESNLLVELSGE